MPIDSEPHYLQVQNLTKQFGTFTAVQDVSISIQEGEFVCFLGPSGCGKTTLLRCIAGLEQQTAGTIIQNQRDISTQPPSDRDFGIVFQSYALFPNLSVFSNIAYGLINKKWKRAAIRERVESLLELVGLQNHSKKYPAQLSGGEQQRVALARALATSPGLLLLDEPLSALDAKVRVYLRKQIKELHRKLGVTTIMVTHDQEEAQSMADRIFVMKDGEVKQAGTPEEIYNSANSPFIADFIGVMNFIPATVCGDNRVRCESLELTCDTSTQSVDDQVQIAIRPESLMMALEPEGAGNWFPACIDEIEFLGSFYRLYIKVDGLGDNLLIGDVPGAKVSSLAIKVGSPVQVGLPADLIQVYPS